MKSVYYGAIVGFFTPIVLIAFNFLPVNENNELRTIVASLCTGIVIGLIIRAFEFTFTKIKSRQ